MSVYLHYFVARFEQLVRISLWYVVAKKTLSFETLL